MAVSHESSFRYEGWRVVLGSGMALFLSTLVVYSFAILLKPLSDEFSWSRQTVSSAYSVMALMSALSGLPVGYLVDRIGARIVVGTALVLLGSVFASLSLLTSRVWTMYVMFGTLGTIATGATPVGYGRALASWFTRHRGLALGLAICGSSIGGMVHPPLTQSLLDVLGWRAAYAVLGAVILVVGVPAAALIRDRSTADSRARDTARGASLSEGLGSRVFWVLLAVVFCNSLVQSSTLVHMAALLTDRGVTASSAALVLSLFGLASLFGRLLTGLLCDRFFATRVSFALIAAAATGAFVLSGANSFVAGTVAAMLLGFGTGGETDAAPYLLSRYFGLRSFSTLYGVTWMTHAAGSALGPILMGRAFDASGSYEALLVRISLVTAAVATLLLTLPRYAALEPQDSAEISRGLAQN
jgi:sugar phosphate permease